MTKCAYAATIQLWCPAIISTFLGSTAGPTDTHITEGWTNTGYLSFSESPNVWRRGFLRQRPRRTSGQIHRAQTATQTWRYADRNMQIEWVNVRRGAERRPSHYDELLSQRIAATFAAFSAPSCYFDCFSRRGATAIDPLLALLVISFLSHFIRRLPVPHPVCGRRLFQEGQGMKGGAEERHERSHRLRSDLAVHRRRSPWPPRPSWVYGQGRLSWKTEASAYLSPDW